MSAHASSKRGKYALALVLVMSALVMIGLPWALAITGHIPPLNRYSGFVLSAAYIAAFIKTYTAYSISGHIRHDKAVYDVATLLMAGTLTCVALQLATADDVYPGLDKVEFYGFLKYLGESARDRHCNFLLISFVASLFVTCLSGVGVKETEEGGLPRYWVAFFFLVNYVLLANYILILISKAH